MSMQPLKPGYRTTEFWMSTVAVGLGTLLASGAIETGSHWEQIIGVVIAGITAVGYTGARSAIKNGPGAQ